MIKTAITEDQEEPTIAVALAAADRFGLKPADAKAILREVFTAVAGWRMTGRKLRLTAGVLDAYASAFEHPLMTEAARVLGVQFHPSDERGRRRRSTLEPVRMLFLDQGVAAKERKDRKEGEL